MTREKELDIAEVQYRIGIGSSGKLMVKVADIEYCTSGYSAHEP